ncbi:MAG: hypothetical protein FWG49_01475 [Leptospirales bacterium]|nr:hypothetical protein [Leptospirales bacterium]
MSLSNNEVNELIQKLREKYKEYSEKHHQKWFDVNAFDERLSLAIKNRMDMEGFILAEISNFEKLKNQYEDKKRAKENSFSKEVDRIFEENLARIKKYPQILFHTKSGMEISYMYGALSFLLTYIFPVTRILITDAGLKKKTDPLEERLVFLADKRDDTYSKRINDHILLLNRQGVKPIEIEKDNSDYLKESGFLLHDIIDLCDSLINLKNDEWSYPIEFQKLFLEEDRKRGVTDLFKGMTGYGAILKIKEFSSGIIEDFRLKVFKQNV